jgi:hypothetical protein
MGLTNQYATNIDINKTSAAGVKLVDHVQILRMGSFCNCPDLVLSLKSVSTDYVGTIQYTHANSKNVPTLYMIKRLKVELCGSPFRACTSIGLKV